MGLYHSPKIVTDGLVFAYDMGNTNKSWKGAPTTNRVPNATAFSGWTNYYRTLARTSFTTEFGTTGWRFINQPSWSGILIGYSVPSTGTYTFSAYYKYLNSSASNNGGSVYVSGWGGNDVAAYVNKNLVGVWQRVQITVTLTNLSGTFYLISFGGTDSGTTSPDYTSFEVTMPMIESGSFATPFVDGTRTNTQAILDLTGLNTVTASSLTYNSDNTFSFNGSTNYATVTGNYHLLNTLTISTWFQPTNTISGGANQAGRLWGKGGNFELRWDGGAGAVNGKFDVDIGGVANLTSLTDQWLNTVWYNVVVVIDSSVSRLYVQSILDATGTVGAFTDQTADMQIGRSASGVGVPFSGKISNFQIYNRALTASEVQQNFTALRGRFGI